jgi:uncharacterized protein (DUF2235 family)
MNMSDKHEKQQGVEGKNVVLLADGTGNASAKLFTTNVWRLYQALDTSDADRQVAYYHDGVGTSSFKVLALLTGGIGYGLKRNVLDLYMFLCRNYRPGDRIFGFGFSRGSFTIRIVMGVVATQGLAPYEGDEKQLAEDALAAYRRFRKNFHTAHHLETLLRRVRDQFFAPLRSRTVLFNKDPARNPRWIHFVGLWDTVDAYGGPIEEITDAIDYWIWPLSMPDQAMSHKIARACHALALDEERRAFWPTLWREGVIKLESGDQQRMDGDNAWQDWWKNWWKDRSASQDAAHIDRDRVSQVWFAGVHSDVGGGYSQNGLSYVTLDWMMKRAIPYGLLVKADEKKRLSDAANLFDKMNDSRSGFGFYYRYQPRILGVLGRADSYKACCLRVWNLMYRPIARWRGWNLPIEVDPKTLPPVIPVVHESVFNRIGKRVNGYAPIAIPEKYKVAYDDGSVKDGPYSFYDESERRADEPMQPAPTEQRRDGEPPETLPERERVWNLVWARRVVYFSALLATICVAAVPFIVRFAWLSHPATDFGRRYLVRILEVVEEVAPKPAAYWIEPAKAAPEYVFAWIAIIVVLWIVSGRLQTSIGNAMRQIWMHQINTRDRGDKLWPAPRVADWTWVYSLRTSPGYREFFLGLKTCILPTIFAWALPLFAMGFFWPWSRYWIILPAVTVFILVNAGCILSAVRSTRLAPPYMPP